MLNPDPVIVNYLPPLNEDVMLEAERFGNSIYTEESLIVGY